MKLTYFQLETHLTKSLATIYIVSGDEILLKQDACTMIRKAAKSNGHNEQIRITTETGFDWDQLYPLLHSTSLFNEKQLIELNFSDSTPPKAAGAILQEYAKQPTPSTILLINVGKIDDKISRSAWYTALEKAGMHIAIWPIPREQLPQWIMQRAKRYKLDLKLDAANVLAEYFEGNLVAAAQAVEKIYLLKPTQAIDTDFISSVLTDESRYNLFEFIDCLIAGNLSRTLHILNSLKNDGTEPVLILWAITRELRLLADMALQLKQGKSPDEAFQKHRIFAKRQPAIRRFLNKVSPENCWQHLHHATQVDKIIKGASPGNTWDALQMLCLRLV
jgi:DNA polymerase-3 subunit delta